MRAYSLLVALVVAGCTSHTPEPAAIAASDEPVPRLIVPNPPPTIPAPIVEPDEPECVDDWHTPLSDARADTYEGIFDIDRSHGGKALQGSWLETPRGQRYILSYRPMPEHLDKLEKRVVVRAAVYDPCGQAIAAEHLQVASIRLADGETPYDSPPTALPPPPQARTRAELRARVNRWVQAVGQLKAVRPDEYDWFMVDLRLDDGTLVSTRVTDSQVDLLYRPRLGTRMTFLGRLSTRQGKYIFDRAWVCEGEVADCEFGTHAVR